MLIILVIKFGDAAEHFISTCSTHAKVKYMKRRARVCAEIHCNIRKGIGVKLDNKHWNDHIPKLVKTSYQIEFTIFWNQECKPVELFVK